MSLAKPMPLAKIVTVHGYQNYPIKLRYWQARDATALVVLVHGVVSHSAWFAPIVEHLIAAGVSCVAPDRRGAGLNTLARGDTPHAEALYSDLDAVLEFSTGRGLPLHIAGFCWGANYLTNYITAREVVCESLCYLVPSFFQSKEMLNAEIVINDSGEASESALTPIDQFTRGPAFETFIKPDPLRLAKVSPRFNGLMQEFSRAVWMKLLKIQTPMLCVLADDDEMVDNAATEILFGMSKNKNGKVDHVGGGHGVQFDTPQQTAEIMFRWFADVQATNVKSSVRMSKVNFDLNEYSN